MLRSKSALLGSAALFGLLCNLVPSVGTAQGSVIYGNFSGTDVTYQNVSESPTQLPGTPPAQLFGPPTISGDTLVFDPMNFDTGVSGGGSELQDGHLSLSIIPAPRGALTSINIMEGGGWAVGGGTSATTALDSLLVNQLFITSVNGVSINPVVVPASITFTDAISIGSATVTKTSSAIEFASTGGISTGTWDGTANFNLPAALAAAGLSGTVTGMSLNLDDQLAASSETNSEAYIDKKFFNVTTADAVPEPASGAILLLSAAGVLSRRRNRKGV